MKPNEPDWHNILLRLTPANDAALRANVRMYGDLSQQVVRILQDCKLEKLELQPVARGVRSHGLPEEQRARRNTTVRLPKELHAKAMATAQARGVTLTSLLNSAIADFFTVRTAESHTAHLAESGDL
jgi:predicted HicB family RNase H-like nuclease